MSLSEYKQQGPKPSRKTLTVLLLLQTISVSAEQPPGMSETYFFEDLPVVLSATRLAQPLSDIPTAMTVIDKDIIKASGALSIPDLLSNGYQISIAYYCTDI